MTFHLIEIVIIIGGDVKVSMLRFELHLYKYVQQERSRIPWWTRSKCCIKTDEVLTKVHKKTTPGAPCVLPYLLMGYLFAILYSDMFRWKNGSGCPSFPVYCSHKHITRAPYNRNTILLLIYGQKVKLWLNYGCTGQSLCPWNFFFISARGVDLFTLEQSYHGFY